MRKPRHGFFKAQPNIKIYLSMYKYKFQYQPGLLSEIAENKVDDCRFCERCGGNLVWIKYDQDIFWLNKSGEKTITTVERLVCKRKKLFIFRCSKYDVFRESSYTIPKIT